MPTPGDGEPPTNAVLGAGVTHFPALAVADAAMAGVFRWALADDEVPAELRDPSGWTDRMRAEWGDDEGLTGATHHREELRRGFERVRQALDAFAPDLVIIFGDDQYELFREDCVPAFAVCAFEDQETKPWDRPMYANQGSGFGEGPDATYRVRGDRAAAKDLTAALLARDIDVAYAYLPAEGRPLPAAFVNTLRYLDWAGEGFPYKSVFFSVNCHGSRNVKTKGGLARLAAFAPGADDDDPPAPSPARCFDVGAAVGEVAAASGRRVALVASSSWSHSFLTQHTYFLRPDVDRDREMYELLVKDKLADWRGTTLEALERAGQHEMLNWFCLAGAVERLGLKRRWTEMIESDVFASNKVFAVFGSPDGD